MLENNNIVGFGQKNSDCQKILSCRSYATKNLCLSAFAEYPQFCRSEIAQLTPGYFLGNKKSLVTASFAGFHSSANQTYFQQITINCEHKFIFGLCGPNGTLFINGRQITQNEIFVLTPKVIYDIVVTRNTPLFVFSLNKIIVSGVSEHFEPLASDLASYKNPVLSIGDIALRDALVQPFIAQLHACTESLTLLAQSTDIAVRLLTSSPHSHYRPNSRSNLISRTLRLMYTKPFDMRKISDIANACFVSQRGLEKAFDSTLNNSPGEYLKAFQLNIYRKAIINEAHSQTTSLSDIALSLGAINYSRLSKDYKSFFGELPSITRRRYG